MHGGGGGTFPGGILISACECPNDNGIYKSMRAQTKK